MNCVLVATQRSGHRHIEHIEHIEHIDRVGNWKIFVENKCFFLVSSMRALKAFRHVITSSCRMHRPKTFHISAIARASMRTLCCPFNAISFQLQFRPNIVRIGFSQRQRIFISKIHIFLARRDKRRRYWLDFSEIRENCEYLSCVCRPSIERSDSSLMSMSMHWVLWVCEAPLFYILSLDGNQSNENDQMKCIKCDASQRSLRVNDANIDSVPVIVRDEMNALLVWVCMCVKSIVDFE